MNLVDRAKNIILTPKTEWPAIAAEPANVSQIIAGYVLPLALIPLVASVIGHAIFTSSMMLGVAQGLIAFIAAILGVFITAFVVDFLAPTFGSQKDFGRSVQLVAYSYTPAWVAGVLNIVPALGILAGLASLYGLYLLYLGLPPIKSTPQDKVIVYLVVTIIVLIVVYFILAAILTPIMFAVFGLSIFALGH